MTCASQSLLMIGTNCRRLICDARYRSAATTFKLPLELGPSCTVLQAIPDSSKPTRLFSGSVYVKIVSAATTRVTATALCIS